MSADAIVVFHPSDPTKLEPFLDLDDESEESEGIYAEKLEDGTYLVHTFQPFEVFLENPDEALSWLETFGDALADIHDDPRGLLFFPDDLEPESTTYDAIIAELGGHGLFVPLVPLLEPVVPLQAMSSYDAGKMIEQMQQQIVDLLGGMQPPEKGEVVDDEFEPEDDK